MLDQWTKSWVLCLTGAALVFVCATGCGTSAGEDPVFCGGPGQPACLDGTSGGDVDDVQPDVDPDVEPDVDQEVVDPDVVPPDVEGETTEPDVAADTDAGNDIDEPDVGDAVDDPDVADADEVDPPDTLPDADPADVDVEDVDPPDTDPDVPDTDVPDTEEDVPSEVDVVEPVLAAEGERCDLEGVCGEQVSCDEGLECIPVGEGATPYCLQPCRLADTGACDDNERLNCRDDFDGDDEGFCYFETLGCGSDAECDYGDMFEGYTCREYLLNETRCEPRHINQSRIGDACGPWAEDMCVPELCGRGLACAAGECVGIAEVPAGSPCSFFADDPLVTPLVCGADTECLNFGGSETFGQCTPRCEGEGAECPEPGQRCIEEPGVDTPFCVSECESDEDCTYGGYSCSGGACRIRTPLVGQGQREFCSQGDETFFEEQRYCAAGLACLSFTVLVGAGPCSEVCSVSTDSCPVDGQGCAAIEGDVGICLETCESDEDCLAFGTNCTQFGETRHCDLALPEGPGEFWDECTRETVTEYCQAGLDCVAPTGASLMCAPRCGSDGSCAAVGGFETDCQSIDGFGDFCFVACIEDGNCPEGLFCEEGVCG